MSASQSRHAGCGYSAQRVWFRPGPKVAICGRVVSRRSGRDVLLGAIKEVGGHYPDQARCSAPLRARRVIRGQHGASPLGSSPDHVKKPRTPPSRTGQTWPAGGRPDSTRNLTSIPHTWCSSTKPMPAPKWRGCVAERRGQRSGRRCRTVTGKTTAFVDALRLSELTAPIVLAGWPDERPGLPGLRRAGAGTHPQAGRYGNHGQLSPPISLWTCGLPS